MNDLIENRLSSNFNGKHLKIIYDNLQKIDLIFNFLKNAISKEYNNKETREYDLHTYISVSSLLHHAHEY